MKQPTNVVQARHYARLKAAGRCSRCKRFTESKHTRCDACKKIGSEYNKQRRAAFIAAGMCSICGVVPVRGLERGQQRCDGCIARREANMLKRKEAK